MLLTLGLYTSGIAPWILFPKMDSNWINAKITFPDGTPGSVTDAATRRLEEALRALDEQQHDRDAREHRDARDVLVDIGLVDDLAEHIGRACGRAIEGRSASRLGPC